MIKNKLTEMLSTFSPDEMKEFEKLVSSVYFSSGRDITGLFKIIKNFYPDFSHKNFNAEYVFKKLFPEKKFEIKSSSNLINTMTSELYRLGKIFLIQTELEGDFNIKNYFLLNALRKKNLVNEFERENVKVEAHEKNSTGGGADYFANKYTLNKAYLEYYAATQDYVKVFETIAKTSDYLTAAALISALNNIEQQTIAENAFNTKTKTGLSGQLIKYIDMNGLMNELKDLNNDFYPYLAINHLAYLMHINPDDEKYLL